MSVSTKNTFSQFPAYNRQPFRQNNQPSVSRWTSEELYYNETELHPEPDPETYDTPAN